MDSQRVSLEARVSRDYRGHVFECTEVLLIGCIRLVCSSVLCFDSLCHVYRNNLLQFCGRFPGLREYDFKYEVVTQDDIEFSTLFYDSP